MSALAIASVVVAAFLPIAALYKLVAREDRKREQTATDDAWRKGLERYEKARSAVMSRDGQSRIGRTGPTTNNTRLVRG